MRMIRYLNRRLLLRYRLEYVVALFVLYGCRALSPAFAWGAARTIGRLLFRLGVRKREGLRNLSIAFPEKSAEEREAILRRSMEHFACMVVDLIFQRRMLDPENVRERVREGPWLRDYYATYGVEGLRRRAKRDIFVTGHFGNWELAAGYFSLLGVRIAPVFRRLQNPFLDRLLRRIRLDTQYEVIEKRGAVQAMLERFERGENVGILFDQRAAHGIEVPFFGAPTRIHKTPAVLLRDHGVGLCFGVVVRRGDFLRYEVHGFLAGDFPKTEDRDADLRAITAELMGYLETEVRRNPEQYLWTHRRWREHPAPEPEPTAHAGARKEVRS